MYLCEMMLACIKLERVTKVLQSLKDLKIVYKWRKLLLSLGVYILQMTNLFWVCFAASGPGQLVIIIGKINSQVRQENVRPSVWQLN